jgi:parallel beta-helix repeat protein
MRYAKMTVAGVERTVDLATIPQSLAPSSALVINGQSNVTISGYRFATSAQVAITMQGCTNVTISRNLFAGCRTGIYLQGCTNVVIERNLGIQFLGPNDDGPHSGQFAQFNQCTGVIRWNVVDNQLPGSDPEDIINVWDSHGTAESPIVVSDNWLRGGSSPTGMGILVGDGSGDYINVTGNVCIDTAAGGIGVAGGNNINVRGNRVTGGGHHWSNVGCYFWNQSGVSAGSMAATGNLLDWRNSSGEQSAAWDGGNVGSIAGLWTDNDYASRPSAEALWALRPNVLAP